MRTYKKFISALLAVMTVIVPTTMPEAYTVSRFSAVHAEDSSDKITWNDMTFQKRSDRTDIFEANSERADELILVSYSGNKENLTIPETVDGKTVTAIYGGVFTDNKTIKNVTLPDTIDFFESRVLKDIYLPEYDYTYTGYVDAGVFQNSSLVSVNIPKSLRIIPNNTFSDCENLESIDFHDQIIGISSKAFENTSFSVPENLYIFDEYTYNSYSDVVMCTDNYLYIQNNHANLDNIEDFAFKFNVNFDTDKNYYAELNYVILQSPSDPSEYAFDIVIPETINGVFVTTMDSRNLKGIIYWKNKYSLLSKGLIRSITFPAYFQNIPNSIFQDRAELEEIIVNASDVTIGQGTFKNTGIKELNLHGSCTIGKEAFSGCTDLKTLIIDGDVDTITIEEGAFRDCTSLETVVFPEKCKFITIGNEAFKNTKISKLEFPSDCSIAKSAFYNCNNLESLVINGNAELLAYSFSLCSNIAEVTIKGQASLKENAFYNCKSLKNINYSELSSVAATTFNGCISLMTINSESLFDDETADLNPKYKDFVIENFKLADDVGFLNLYITEQMKKIVSENTTDDMTDMQKLKALHDWVCNNTVYNAGNEEVARTDNDASVLLNDTTVCEGYARTLNLLLNTAGIESYYISGVKHAWNIVKLGGHYFHVDSTWDDGDTISYNWFLKSDSELTEAGGNHASWKLFQPSSLHSFQGTVLPECTYKMGDMNTDGSISIADLVMMNKYLLGAEELNADDYILSDLNFDGKTDAFDMVIMRKKIIG